MSIISEGAHITFTIPKMKLNPLIAFAAGLLAVSAILHIAMLYFHGSTERTIPIAVFGLIYLVISIFLMKHQKWALYAAAIMTTIGMILASYAYYQTEDHFPLDIVFIIIDIMVVPIFWYFIIKKRPLLSFTN